MIALLSPSKKLDNKKTIVDSPSSIRFAEEANILVQRMKKKKARDLKSLMGISDKLAELNVNRYQAFEDEFNVDNSNTAIYEFRGDVFVGLDADSLDNDQIDFAQNHIRILSGLYGYLRPKDLIQAYRLEMGTKLKIRRKNNLYQFWGDKITNAINEELNQSENKILFNLASNEYAEVVDFNRIDGEVVHFTFKEWRNEKWTFISFNAKKARGLVARYIIENNVQNKAEIKGFNLENYAYNEELSSGNQLVFSR